MKSFIASIFILLIAAACDCTCKSESTEEGAIIKPEYGDEKQK